MLEKKEKKREKKQEKQKRYSWGGREAAWWAKEGEEEKVQVKARQERGEMREDRQRPEQCLAQCQKRWKPKGSTLGNETQTRAV